MPLVPERALGPPVRMIKLTERQEITPYKWVHPDEERQRAEPSNIPAGGKPDLQGSISSLDR